MPMKNFIFKSVLSMIRLQKIKQKRGEYRNSSCSWSAEDLMNLFTDSKKITKPNKRGFAQTIIIMLSMIRREKQIKKRGISTISPYPVLRMLRIE